MTVPPLWGGGGFTTKLSHSITLWRLVFSMLFGPSDAFPPWGGGLQRGGGGTALSWGDGFFTTFVMLKTRFSAVFAGRYSNATAT